MRLNIEWRAVGAVVAAALGACSGMPPDHDDGSTLLDAAMDGSAMDASAMGDSGASAEVDARSGLDAGARVGLVHFDLRVTPSGNRADFRVPRRIDETTGDYYDPDRAARCETLFLGECRLVRCSPSAPFPNLHVGDVTVHSRLGSVVFSPDDSGIYRGAAPSYWTRGAPLRVEIAGANGFPAVSTLDWRFSPERIDEVTVPSATWARARGSQVEIRTPTPAVVVVALRQRRTELICREYRIEPKNDVTDVILPFTASQLANFEAGPATIEVARAAYYGLGVEMHALVEGDVAPIEIQLE